MSTSVEKKPSSHRGIMMRIALQWECTCHSKVGIFSEVTTRGFIFLSGWLIACFIELEFDVVQAGLKLSLKLKMTLDSQSSFSLPSDGTTVLCTVPPFLAGLTETGSHYTSSSTCPGTHYVAQIGLEFSPILSCFCLLNAGILGMCYCTS